MNRVSNGRINRVRRAAERGVTLIEVMIVLVIMGLIAGLGVTVIFPRLKEGKIKTAVISASKLKQTAEYYKEMGGSDCPTIQELLNAKKIKAEEAEDPWGSNYKIVCDGDLKVVSPGPDKKESTPDDCRDDFPKKQADVDKIVNM